MGERKEEEVRGLHKRVDNISIIWLRYIENSKGLDIVKILTHEALHCTFATAKFAGIYHSYDSEEFFTYFQEWVMSQMLTCLGYNPPIEAE